MRKYKKSELNKTPHWERPLKLDAKGNVDFDALAREEHIFQGHAHPSKILLKIHPKKSNNLRY